MCALQIPRELTFRCDAIFAMPATASARFGPKLGLQTRYDGCGTAATMGSGTGATHVRPTSPGTKLTYDDFLLFPDDGKRHELIDGEHYVTPSPNTKHQRVSGNLFWLIRSHLEAHPVGKVFYAPFDIVLSRFDVVEPDLLYMSNERAAAVLTPQNTQGAPELIVEIASPGTRKRDETIKRRLYERMGVTEYWVVDPVIDAVRVYRLSDGRYTRPVEWSAESGDRITTALLPGLELPLSEIFRE
jgi:Uma2 family endonuclease